MVLESRRHTTPLFPKCPCTQRLALHLTPGGRGREKGKRENRKGWKGNWSTGSNVAKMLGRGQSKELFDKMTINRAISMAG